LDTVRKEATMADRENSPAYAALPRSARRVFAAIERAIGGGSGASVSYVDFRLRRSAIHQHEFHVAPPNAKQ